MNTAIFSVVYPSAASFLPEFLSSLADQTDKDFKIFLINDGLSNVKRFLDKFDLSIHLRNAAGSPTALRKEGIQWVIDEGADVIVFADSDDYFAENRIEISKKMLNDFDIVCNELIMVGEKYRRPVPMIGQRLKDRERIGVRHLISANCMGLSNTAVRGDKIAINLSHIPEDLVACDWALFAFCLHTEAKAIYTKKTETYYRQHKNNVACPHSFTKEQIMQGVRVKRDHYRLLSKFYSEYKTLATIFEQLFDQLQSNVSLKRRYCQAVQAQTAPFPLWWEHIKPLEELGL